MLLNVKKDIALLPPLTKCIVIEVVNKEAGSWLVEVVDKECQMRKNGRAMRGCEVWAVLQSKSTM